MYKFIETESMNSDTFQLVAWPKENFNEKADRQQNFAVDLEKMFEIVETECHWLIAYNYSWHLTLRNVIILNWVYNLYTKVS